MSNAESAAKAWTPAQRNDVRLGKLSSELRV